MFKANDKNEEASKLIGIPTCEDSAPKVSVKCCNKGTAKGT